MSNEKEVTEEMAITYFGVNLQEMKYVIKEMERVFDVIGHLEGTIKIKFDKLKETMNLFENEKYVESLNVFKELEIMIKLERENIMVEKTIKIIGESIKNKDKTFSVTFEESAKEDILDIFDIIIDDEGYLVEKDNPEQRVLTPNGEEILKEEWAGIYRGYYIKNDIISLMKLSKEMNKNKGDKNVE